MAKTLLNILLALVESHQNYITRLPISFFHSKIEKRKKKTLQKSLRKMLFKYFQEQYN